MTSTTTESPALELKALKSLGELAEALPLLLQDSREQIGLGQYFRRLPYQIATLSEGDYGVSGVPDFAVELKGSLDELAQNVIGNNRERLEREMNRLLPYKFRRLLVVGATCDRDILSFPYRSDINPKSVLGSLYSWQAQFQLPFVLTPTRESAASLIETWAIYHCRTIVQAANHLLRAYWQATAK